MEVCFYHLSPRAGDIICVRVWGQCSSTTTEGRIWPSVSDQTCCLDCAERWAGNLQSNLSCRWRWVGRRMSGNFRENIKNNYLPLPTDVTYEGFFYDYYFDTGLSEVTNKLFSPAYSYAVTPASPSKKSGRIA